MGNYLKETFEEFCVSLNRPLMLMLQNFPKEPFQKEIWSFWSNKRAKVCQAFRFFTFQKTTFFKKNGPIPVSFCLFLVFWDKHYIFIANQLEKLYCPYSIWPWDSNPWPLKHKPFPITTRPVANLINILWS